MFNFANLALFIGWMLAIFIVVLEGIFVAFIVMGRINITRLISDENGDASLSRFQFLIFTFVISMSLFYLIASVTPPAFPRIPVEILGLLGISGGTYAIAKGIQASRDTGLAEAEQASGITDSSTRPNGAITIVPPANQGITISPKGKGITVAPLPTNNTVNAEVVTSTPGKINPVSLQGEDLYIGSSGSDVEKLQQQLKELGLYFGLINGNFDQETESAVREFQDRAGLTANGIVDPLTWHELQNSLVGGTT